MKKKKESILIDCLLVVLYFIVVLGLVLSVCVRNDFLIEFGIPGILIAAVSIIFLNYLNKIIHTHSRSKGTEGRLC